MRIKLLFIFFLVITAFVSKANDIVFVVYHVKGQVSKNAKVKIKKGDKVLGSEAIIVGDNSTLMLVCSNYKVIQVNKKGAYTAKSLLSQCSTTAAGYSSSYFKYVWNEFTHPHGKPSEKPEDYMKNVGAVSRGCNMLETGIRVDTLHFSAGSKDELPVYWKSNFAQNILAVYDVAIDGAPLRKTLLKQNEPVRMEQVIETLPVGEYYWTIIDNNGNGCERNYLKIWEPELYKQQLKKMSDSFPSTTVAENAFADAFVFHENHFLAEALKYYKLASSFSMGNKIYKKSLSKFYESKF